MVIGTRIPRKYFVTKGIGESQHTHHAGSFHLALEDARIETQNIMTYSSILPKEAIEIERPDELIFGGVMECIMSKFEGHKGELLSAGIAYGWLYDENDEKIGGVVVERNGSFTEEELRMQLKNSLTELKRRSFSNYKMLEGEYITQTFIPTEAYGTALVAICFVDYILPIVEE